MTSFATLDFSPLKHFFTIPTEQRASVLFDWGQKNLLLLQKKSLEKACADLIMFFRTHPEQSSCPNLINPPIYWGHDKDTVSHQQLNYALKEYIMFVLVYKDCPYISFNNENKIIWDFESKETRYLYKNTADKKTHPERKIKSSHFTLEQKDIIWDGVSVGFLNVPEVETKKKSSKTVIDEEYASENVEGQSIEANAKKIYQPVESPYSVKTQTAAMSQKENIKNNHESQKNVKEINQENEKTSQVIKSSKNNVEKTKKTKPKK